MDNDSVKNTILKIREARGLSQEEMAESIGMCRNTYRKVEKGKTQLISQTVFKIAEFANVTPEEVVLGYLPVQDSANRLQDFRNEYENKLRKQRTEFCDKIEALNKELESLKELLKSKDETIYAQKAMLAMLQKQMDESER